MTSTELTKKQNGIMNAGLTVKVKITRYESGEYGAWIDGDIMSGDFWPTVGEAVENAIWEHVNRIIKECDNE